MTEIRINDKAMSAKNKKIVKDSRIKIDYNKLNKKKPKKHRLPLED